MKKIVVISLLVLGILTTNIYATSDNYIGLGYSQMSYSESGFKEVNPSAISLKYGKKFDTNFAFEIRGAIGIADDTLNVHDIAIDVDCNNMLGIYGVGKKYLTKDFSLNGIIGLTRAKFTSKSTNGVVGTTVENYEVDFSYGVGIGYRLDNKSLELEYIRYIRKKYFELDAINLNFSFYF